MLTAIIVLQIIIFSGLIFFLRQILTKDVRRATQHLEQQEEEYEKKEAELKKRLSESQSYYEEMLKKANDEASLVRTQSLKEVQEVRDKTLETARVQSEEIIRRANKLAEQLKLELTSGMADQALERACSLIQEALPVSLQKAIHTQWVEELVSSDLGTLDRMHLPAAVKEAEVKSAFPLTQEQQAQLKKRLKEKVKKEIEIKEVREPRVVAGLVVSIGGIVLDGSLTNRIREIARKNVGEEREKGKTDSPV